MNLTQLFLAVKEENLDKWQLENYHKEMSEFKAQIHLELGSIKKKRAMFEISDPNRPVAQSRRAWQALPEGQREIELKSMLSAVATHLKSLQNRLYSNY